MAVFSFILIALSAVQGYALLNSRYRVSKIGSPASPLLVMPSSSDSGEEVSLISVLTIFEQMRSQYELKNSRISSELEKSANKFLDQFLKGFEERYSLAKESVANIAISLNDDSEVGLSEEAKLVKSLVLEQLARVEEHANDVIFYNEPLTKLEETGVPLSLSSNIFLFSKASYIRQKVLISKNFTKSNIENFLKSDTEDATISMPTEAVASTRDGLGNVKKIVKILEQRQLERSKKSKEWFEREELRKIKVGLKAEQRRWRKDLSSGKSFLDVATRRLALSNRHTLKVVDNVRIFLTYHAILVSIVKFNHHTRNTAPDSSRAGRALHAK